MSVTRIDVDEHVIEAPDLANESATQVVADGMTSSDGVNVRYATLYGPRTWYSPDGEIGQRFRKRIYPMIGSGEAVMSFVHVEDATAATIAALESDATGAFNVADDEPAVASEWMPLFAAAIGAPRPIHAPVFLARIIAGTAAVHLAVNSRAASNARLKDELSWRPQFASWRSGFASLRL